MGFSRGSRQKNCQTFDPISDDSLETRGLRRGESGNSSTMAFPQFSGTLWDQLTWLAMENHFNRKYIDSLNGPFFQPATLVYRRVSAIGTQMSAAFPKILVSTALHFQQYIS